jgi:cyclophilin family peptidyl-prolyl cis-trans isomerase
VTLGSLIHRRAGAALLAFALTAGGCMGPGSLPAGSPSLTGSGTCPTSQPPALAAGDKRAVTIETPLGQIVLDIEAGLSPIAAANFVALADCGFYDGVVFHRVVRDFVIQGGDGEFGRKDRPDAGRPGTGGPGYTIADEAVTAKYGRATVAMARTPEPNSVGSQFFIVLDDGARAALESANTYQIIGSVSSGMTVVDAIAAAADAQSPSDPVVMTDVSVATP